VHIRNGMAGTKWTLLLALGVLAAACTDRPAKRVIGQDALASIGATLFKDPRLGADGQTSCATCHVAEQAFTDARPLAVGAFGRAGTRNSPSLIGLNAEGPQFWDGRTTRLSDAVMQPLGNPAEMGYESVAAAMQRIAELPEYRSHFGDAIRQSDIAAALTQYLLQLDVGSSPYERARTVNDYSQLDPAAQRGMRLFQGKAQCASCHLPDGTPSFSDERFHHASVGFERIAGNIRPLQERLEAAGASGRPIGHLIMADADIAELGRFAVTANPQDMAAFRTPNLRNVARTAPYMHDGSIPTLEAAIEHELYYRGLASGQPINLTVEERRDLLVFLEALSTP
jgi:cytochrome c peroxidase